MKEPSAQQAMRDTHLDMPQQHSREMRDFLSPWEHRLEKHGWPVIALVLFLVCGWRFIVWFQPKADQVIEGHAKLVGTLSEQVPKQTAAIEKQAEALETTSEILERMSSKVDDIHNRVVKPNGLP